MILFYSEVKHYCHPFCVQFYTQILILKPLSQSHSPRASSGKRKTRGQLHQHGWSPSTYIQGLQLGLGHQRRRRNWAQLHSGELPGEGTTRKNKKRLQQLGERRDKLLWGQILNEDTAWRRPGAEFKASLPNHRKPSQRSCLCISTELQSLHGQMVSVAPEVSNRQHSRMFFHLCVGI